MEHQSLATWIVMDVIHFLFLQNPCKVIPTACCVGCQKRHALQLLPAWLSNSAVNDFGKWTAAWSSNCRPVNLRTSSRVCFNHFQGWIQHQTKWHADAWAWSHRHSPRGASSGCRNSNYRWWFFRQAHGIWTPAAHTNHTERDVIQPHAFDDAITFHKDIIFCEGDPSTLLRDHAFGQKASAWYCMTCASKEFKRFNGKFISWATSILISMLPRVHRL